MFILRINATEEIDTYIPSKCTLLSKQCFLVRLKKMAFYLFLKQILGILLWPLQLFDLSPTGNDGQQDFDSAKITHIVNKK